MASPLVVVTGFGGVNAAGRSSAHHGYRRCVIDSLDQSAADETWRSLAGLMSYDRALDDEARAYIRKHTLIRRIEEHFFDPDDVAFNRRLEIAPDNGALSFEAPARQVPTPLPSGWTVEALGRKDGTETVRIKITEPTEVLVKNRRALGVSAAGQVPTGFDPKALYQARSHPRGLQLAIFAANDALGSLGIEWQQIVDLVHPDRISLYAGSALGQLDTEGNGGLLAARFQGGRPTSKNVAMGLGEMPADFVNAYVLGSLGTTGHNMGACATFLYNLRHGLLDIQSGRSRVALVGGAEAPLVPELVEGLSTMGALAQDRALLELDPGREVPDWTRACRPFAENCGFTLAEGSHFVVLMDEELALETGASIYGALTDVHVHADGHKKSISSPGVGNYVTFAKAVANAYREFGETAIKRSFVQAHGTGTPQNRVTESEILDKVAEAFGISDWPVAAVKCFVGHTMAVAGGDQLLSCLGTWHYGIVPGISTIDQVADDVATTRLRISPEPLAEAPDAYDMAFLNAKGFGGNNATATLVAPHVVRARLEATRSAAELSAWQDRNEAVEQRANDWDQAATDGTHETTYRFDYQVRHGEHVQLDRDHLHIAGVGTISLASTDAD